MLIELTEGTHLKMTQLLSASFRGVAVITSV